MPSVETGYQIQQGYLQAIRVLSGELCGAAISDAHYELIRLSKQVAGSSMPLYRALFVGEPFDAEPENVENLNAMQCFWASEKVFSWANDFSFAKHVLERTPEASETKIVRLSRWSRRPVGNT